MPRIDSWTEAEDRLIRENYPALGASETQRILFRAGFQRNTAAVRKRANTIGLKRGRADSKFNKHKV